MPPSATPENEIRSSVLRASQEILSAGLRVNRRRLRELGVLGADYRIRRVRKELVDSGELPKETFPETERTRHPRGECSPRTVAAPNVEKERQLTLIQLLILQHKLRRPQDFKR